MWGNRSYLTQITLNRLSRDGIEQMASRVAGGKTLPEAVLQQLVEPAYPNHRKALRFQEAHHVSAAWARSSSHGVG